MVIKVDFDITMSILASNIYRLFALDLDRYAHLSVQSLFEKFILSVHRKIKSDFIGKIV